MDHRFRIVFRGRLQPDRSVADVAPQLAHWLRLDVQQAGQLFDGRRVILKRGLARDALPRYLVALSTAGLIVETEREPPQAPPPSPRTPAAPDPAAAAEARMLCPKCGQVQPRRTLCQTCGVDVPRYVEAMRQARDDSMTRFVERAPTLAATAARRRASPAPRPPLLGLDLAGRMGRQSCAVALLLAGAACMAGWGIASLAGWAGMLAALAGSAIALRALILRCHDLGLRAYWLLWGLVPLIGWLLVLAGMLRRGQARENRWGPAPQVASRPQWLATATAMVVAVAAVALPTMQAQPEPAAPPAKSPR